MGSVSISAEDPRGIGDNSNSINVAIETRSEVNV